MGSAETVAPEVMNCLAASTARQPEPVQRSSTSLISAAAGRNNGDDVGSELSLLSVLLPLLPLEEEYVGK